MTCLLDTDVVSELRRRQPDARADVVRLAVRAGGLLGGGDGSVVLTCWRVVLSAPSSVNSAQRVGGAVPRMSLKS